MLQTPTANSSVHPVDKAAPRRSSKSSQSRSVASGKSSKTPPPPAATSSLSSMITTTMDAKMTTGMKETILRNNQASTAAAAATVAKPPLPTPPAPTTTKAMSSPRSVASSVHSSRQQRATTTTTPMVKTAAGKSRRISETSISLAGMRAKMHSKKKSINNTKHGSMNTLDQALDHHQKRSLLDDLDKLATHLPATVLDQVIKQVVLENNESQVWSLLGKSIEFTKKIQGNSNTTTTKNEQSHKKKPKAKRKLPTRSRSIRSLISNTSIDSPYSHGKSETDSHSSSLGMTLDSDSDSEHDSEHDSEDSDSEHGNVTTDDDDDDDDSLSEHSMGSGLQSNTSSMADDLTWAMAGTMDEEDDDTDSDEEDTGTIGRNNLSHTGLTTRSQRSCAGAIEARKKRYSESHIHYKKTSKNQPTKSHARRKSDTNLIMMDMLDEDKQEEQAANSKDGEDKEVAKLCQGRLSSTLNEDTNNSFHESITHLSAHESLRSGGTAAAETEAAASLVAANAAVGKKRLASTRHTSALLFVDISGFTKLSRSLEVEQLSKVCIYNHCSTLSGCLTHRSSLFICCFCTVHIRSSTRTFKRLWRLSMPTTGMFSNLRAMLSWSNGKTRQLLE